MGQHPKGLYVLFGTEMAERFSYYGMRAIFTLYMTKALLMDKSLASAIYGDYTGLVYLTPLIGGYVADNFWGNRKSIIVGGLLMALGQFFMFISAANYQNVSFATAMMFGGLGLLIVGNGFFKPNISTMVAALYKQGDTRVDGAFSIFYMGINAGALLAPMICGGFGDTGLNESFKWGFLAACIGMLLSLAAFMWLKDKFIITPDGEAIGAVPAHPAKADSAEEQLVIKRNLIPWFLGLVGLFLVFKGFVNFDYIGSFIFACCIIAPLVIVTDPALTKVERDRVWVIVIMAFFVICFWAAFEQAGSTLTFFADEQTDRGMFGYVIPASFFQIINPTFIVILAPIMAILWGKLNDSNREPASLIKQAVGLVLVGVGYIVICFAVKDMDPNTKTPVLWLISLYFIHTVAELCLSPIGLSMVARLAPVRLASLMMGVWFLSTALANWTAGFLGTFYPQDVKIEAKGVIATNFKVINPAMDSIGKTQMFKADSTMQIGGLTDGGTWKVVLASDDDAKPAAKSFGETLVGNFSSDPLIKALSGKKTADTLLSVTQVSAKSTAKVEPYKQKQMISAAELEKFKKKHNRDYAYKTGISEDGKMMYILNEDGQLEGWDMSPTKPFLFGIEITNMYKFFMIFVVMSFISGLCLFLLSRRLLGMMHGIR
jgi:proton-dependent oligopeptide transporter, POT family